MTNRLVTLTLRPFSLKIAQPTALQNIPTKYELRSSVLVTSVHMGGQTDGRTTSVVEPPVGMEGPNNIKTDIF